MHQALGGVVENPGMALGIDRRVGPAVIDVLGRMNDLRARRFGDRVVFVDVVEIDEDAHRRRAGVERRAQAALLRALPHHDELALERSFAMHAAARRAAAHLFLEAEGAGEKVERGRHVAIEEVGDDLRRSRGRRHRSVSFVRAARRGIFEHTTFSKGGRGSGPPHFSFVVQLTS